MSRRLPNLNALRAFEAAGRNLSFSRAADELRVTQGAVSRQIKALEQYLGISLFRRLARTVELTEQGKEYLPVTRDAFDRIEQASARLIGGARHEILTVSVLPTFAMRWLIPRLIHFTDANSDVEVRMITTIRPVNFSREDIDVAIRVGTPPQSPVGAGPRIDLQMTDDWSQVRVAFLMPDVMVPVCSVSYLERTGWPRSAADLAAHTLLHNATRSHAWPDWLRGMGVELADPLAGPSFGHFFMALQAAIEGRGIALIPRLLAEDDLRARRIVAPLEAALESAGGYYLLCRTNQWNVERIRRFRQWLLSEASKGIQPLEQEQVAAPATQPPARRGRKVKG